MDRTADTRIVEHHVQAAKTLDGKIHQFLYLTGIGDIRSLECRGRAEHGRERFALLGVHVRDHHPGALLHEQLHGGTAEAARTARDDGNLAGKQLAHRVLMELMD